MTTLRLGGIRSTQKQRITSTRRELHKSGSPLISMGAEYDKLKSIPVIKVSSGQSTPVTSSWSPSAGSGKTIVVMLTHFGDLTAWEYAQKLRHYLPQLQAKGASVRVVGIGGVEAAKEFCASNNFPEDLMYADPNADSAAALGLSPGFGRSSGVCVCVCVCFGTFVCVHVCGIP
jgi:hypothetical protein